MNQFTLSAAEALELTTQALTLAGGPVASVVAEALVDAEARGHPRFGLRLLTDLPSGSRDELADALSFDDSDPAGTGAVDLRGKFAPTAVAGLINPARIWAGEHGVSLIRLREVGPFGRLAPYVTAIAQRGAVGLLTMSSRSFVTPIGGHRPVLGTNPFALGVPTERHPLVVDTASSAITAAQWHTALAAGSAVSEGLIDASGRPTTDAREAVAIAPRGGLLGTSVGIAVEALTAAVTGLLSDPYGATRGGLLMVIEPAEGAARLGEELTSRILHAGGRVPGQPLAWPDTIAVDPEILSLLTRLAALA